MNSAIYCGTVQVAIGLKFSKFQVLAVVPAMEARDV